ncbi:MAG TPA: class I SAM-dependent methyltransferase [Roseomonas sp.]|jgi:SAM-dependent methyltransferase
MAESFDGDWLDLREPFDARARDGGLATMLAAALPARPRILDLGAGTGALLRWLGHWIGRAQAWTLVDADGALLARAFETIRYRAEAVGWAVTAPDRRTLLVHAPGGAWRVEGLVADLNDAPDNLPLDRFDAVVNTALCDLVSEDWLADMAEAIVEHGLPFYSALNVDGRERFSPPHPADALVARGFARDQLRDKGFGGIALGARAPVAMARLFAGQGYAVHRAASPWRIGRRDGAMAASLAEGHALAASAWERRGEAKIERWIRARHAQAAAGRLTARIGHADILALPG